MKETPKSSSNTWKKTIWAINIGMLLLAAFLLTIEVKKISITHSFDFISYAEIILTFFFIQFVIRKLAIAQYQEALEREANKSIEEQPIQPPRD